MLDPTRDEEYRIFPNPSYSGEFEVQFPGEIAYIHIIDQVGNLVFDILVTNRSKTKLITKGVFILTVRTDNQVFIKKMVIDLFIQQQILMKEFDLVKVAFLSESA